MPKYYYVHDKDYNRAANAIVTAENANQARSKYVNNDVIPYFRGWDNSDFDYTEVYANRVLKLDQFQPDDTFNILKTLVTQYNWIFYDADDNPVITPDNYTDIKLKNYLSNN